MPLFVKIVVILYTIFYIIVSINFMPVIFKHTTLSQTLFGLGLWIIIYIIFPGAFIGFYSNDILRYKRKLAEKADLKAEKTKNEADIKRAQRLWDEYESFKDSM